MIYMFFLQTILFLVLSFSLVLAQGDDDRISVKYTVKVKKGGLTLVSADGKVRVDVEEDAVLNVRDYGTHKYEIIGLNRHNQSVVFYAPVNKVEVLNTLDFYSVRPSRNVITAYSRPNQTGAEAKDCPTDSSVRGYTQSIPDELCKVGWPSDNDRVGMFVNSTDVVQTPNGWEVWSKITYKYTRPVDRAKKHYVTNEGHGWVPIRDLKYDGRSVQGKNPVINIGTTPKKTAQNSVNTDDPNLRMNPDPTHTEGGTVIECKSCQQNEVEEALTGIVDDERLFTRIFELIGDPVNSCKTDSSLGLNARRINGRTTYETDEKKMFFTKHYRDGHWYKDNKIKKLPRLRSTSGKIHDPMDIVAVDACARTCYGEMGLAQCAGTGIGNNFTISDPPAYIMATVKTMHCRAEESRRAKSIGHEGNQRNVFLNSKDPFLNHDLIAVTGSSCQYSVWNNQIGCRTRGKNKSQEKILCPPKQESEEQGLNDAHKARIRNKAEREIYKACARQCYNLVYNKEKFLEDTKGFNHCDYTSNTGRGYHNGNKRLTGRNVPKIAGIALSNGRCMELYDER